MEVQPLKIYKTFIAELQCPTAQGKISLQYAQVAVFAIQEDEMYPLLVKVEAIMENTLGDNLEIVYPEDIHTEIVAQINNELYPVYTTEKLVDFKISSTFKEILESATVKQWKK